MKEKDIQPATFRYGYQKEFNEQQKAMVEEKSKKEVQSNGNYRI